MSGRPCERNDMRALIAVWTYWSVDDDGLCRQRISTVEADAADMEEYYCANCGECFSPGDGVGSESLDAAWRRGLDHLGANGEGAGDMLPGRDRS